MKPVRTIGIVNGGGDAPGLNPVGHVQRGGSPTARDRVLATRYGLKAADLVHEGRYGQMAALHGDAIVEVPLAEATAELKTVPPDWYDVARAFFG